MGEWTQEMHENFEGFFSKIRKTCIWPGSGEITLPEINTLTTFGIAACSEITRLTARVKELEAHPIYSIQRCPVCDGCGTVDHTFYTKASASSSCERQQCKRCAGIGTITLSPTPSGADVQPPTGDVPRADRDVAIRIQNIGTLPSQCMTIPDQIEEGGKIIAAYVASRIAEVISHTDSDQECALAIVNALDEDHYSVLQGWAAPRRVDKVCKYIALHRESCTRPIRERLTEAIRMVQDVSQCGVCGCCPWCEQHLAKSKGQHRGGCELQKLLTPPIIINDAPSGGGGTQNG
jgi:hypothetical protein